MFKASHRSGTNYGERIIRMKLNVFAALTCASLIACNAASESGGYVPPKVGTEFNWKYIYESEATKAVVKVVATGPDFAVFLEKDSTAFVEFSGLDFMGCDEELPTADIRAALFDAWPLTAGTEIVSTSATITIKDKSVYRLDSKNQPVVWMDYDSATAGESDDEFAISTDLNTIVQYKWGDGSEDLLSSVRVKDVKTVEVQPGYHMVAGLNDPLVIGCLKLLTETE